MNLDRLVISKNIRVFRAIKGLRQKDLAVACDRSISVIHGIENASRRIRLEELNAIAGILEISPERLSVKNAWEGF